MRGSSARITTDSVAWSVSGSRLLVATALMTGSTRDAELGDSRSRIAPQSSEMDERSKQKLSPVQAAIA